MEAPLQKLKRLVGESKEIRHGNISGKKKEIANKMTHAQKMGNRVSHAIKNSNQGKQDHKDSQSFNKRFGSLEDRLNNFRK